MSSPTIFNFDSTTVRVVTGTNGEPWFVAADVCAVLDIGNNRQAVAPLDDDEKGVTTVDTLGGAQQMTIINESGLYSLVLGSRKPEAKRFKKWVTSEVLPTIRKTGSYIQQPQRALSGAASDIELVDMLKKSLSLSNSSHLGLVQHVLKKHDKADFIPLLPQYAIDAPTSSTTGSSEPTASASTLLKKHDIKMSTVKFNTKLVEIGLLADMTRPSTSSPTGFKTFKAVVGKGLDYGKNVTNPGNPRETQPHWYSHKFLDLIGLLK
jgi:prophage antirepressor-like protein